MLLAYCRSLCVWFVTICGILFWLSCVYDETSETGTLLWLSSGGTVAIESSHARNSLGRNGWRYWSWWMRERGRWLCAAATGQTLEATQLEINWLLVIAFTKGKLWAKLPAWVADFLSCNSQYPFSFFLSGSLCFCLAVCLPACLPGLPIYLFALLFAGFLYLQICSVQKLTVGTKSVRYLIK